MDPDWAQLLMAFFRQQLDDSRDYGVLLSPCLTEVACGYIAADLISALSTGTHLDIAATDQIRPIATTIAIPIDVRICIPLRRVELGE